MNEAGTYKRVDEATPNGGAYSVGYYKGSNGKPCKEADAVACEIVEYNADGQPIARTYGRMKQSDAK